MGEGYLTVGKRIDRWGKGNGGREDRMRCDQGGGETPCVWRFRDRAEKKMDEEGGLDSRSVD